MQGRPIYGSAGLTRRSLRIDSEDSDLSTISSNCDGTDVASGGSGVVGEGGGSKREMADGC